MLDKTQERSTKTTDLQRSDDLHCLIMACPSCRRFKRLFTWINRQPVSDRMYGGGGHTDGDVPVTVTALECQVRTSSNSKPCLRSLFSFFEDKLSSGHPQPPRVIILSVFHAGLAMEREWVHWCARVSGVEQSTTRFLATMSIQERAHGVHLPLLKRPL